MVHFCIGRNYNLIKSFSDEFKAFAQEKPEYAPLFLAYQQHKEGNTNGNAVIQEANHPKSE